MIKCSLGCSLGFSLFRIASGITMLIAGYDKVINIFKIGFNPEKFGLLQFFLSSFHGENSAMSPQVQIFFPKFSIYILSYILPFWELAIGLLLVLGFFRILGSYLGIILMLVFLAGTQGASLGATSIIEMYIMLISYFLIYLGVKKPLEDPLALDNIIRKK